MSSISVMVVDDSPIFLEGLCTVLSYDDINIHIVASHTNPLEVFESYGMHLPDVVLLDIKMPEMSGVDVAREILLTYPNAKIIMLTTFDDRDMIIKAIQAGAKGYYLKDTPVEQIVDAIKTVISGNILMSQDIMTKLAEPDRSQSQEYNLTDTGGCSPVPQEIRQLSHREKEVLLKIGNGMTNMEIAEKLFLSEKTIRNYVSRIYEILGVSKRSKVIIWTQKNRDNLC